MNPCALCPRINKIVPSIGPTPCNVMLIAEAPGRDEDRKGVPLIGKTGREVNEHYLPLAGLSRDRVYIANTVSCLPVGDGKLDPKNPKHKALIQCCAEHHLYEEIRACNPKVIVVMGGVINSLIPSTYLDYDHGFIKDWDVPGDKTRKVFVQYHPSLGIHEPKKMLMIRNDWIRLRKYLNNTLHVPVDEYAGVEDYREIITEQELRDSLNGYEQSVLACDTENRKDHSPFCITYSVVPGTGYLIRAERIDLLDIFQEYLDRWEGKILWHNWLYDFEITTAMGLRFRHNLIVDTMLKAYHLGNLPQGLKALTYRELGMNMQDFDDLVRPYSTQLILKYLRYAHCEEWPKPEQQLVKQKDGTWKVLKPHGFNQKLKRFFTDYEKNDEKDVFGMWYGNWVDEHEMVEEKLGSFPGLCISHVPFHSGVIRYACRDADALLRLYPILKHMERNVRRTVQERWRE